MGLTEHLAAVVLAAGQARRLGCDKATLPWAGTTLLRHVLDQFQTPCVARRVVVLNPQNEITARESLPADVQVTVNRQRGAEMVSSVRVGVNALRSFAGPVCIHPVDVFGVSRELVAVLHARWRAQPDCLHLPEVRGKGGHPLIVPPALLPEIGRIPSGQGLNWLLREHVGAVVRHAWQDERLLADIDTLEDYERYRPQGS